MTCCTGNTIELGCIYSCDNISTGQAAIATGVYTLVLMPDLIKVTSATVTIGNEIIFSGGYLNEDGVSIFKIKKPDGTYLTSGGSDCFEVDIRPTTNATLATTGETGDCNTINVYVNSVLESTTTTCDALVTINIP